MSSTAVREGIEAGAEAASRRLTTVVAADICGYSRLAETSDDAAVRTVTLVRAAFERVVAKRRGRIFHSAGDGFLAEFPSAADGVLAALEFVADIKARNRLSPTSPGAKVRAGVHAGDVIEQPGGDLLGHGVNIAARLQGEAEPNGVLVSLAAVNLVRGSVDAHFSRRGPLALKNIDGPVVAFDAEGGLNKRRLPRFLGRLRLLQPFRIATFVIAAALIYLTADAFRDTRVRSPGAPADAGSPANLARVDGDPMGQEATEIDEALRSLKVAARAPSETVWLRGILKELRRSGDSLDREVFRLLANQDLGAAVRTLKQTFEERKPFLGDAERISYLLTLGGMTFDHAPGDSVAFHRAVLDIEPMNFLAQVRLGELYYNQSDYVRADRAFREALKIGSPHRDRELYAQIKYAASLTIEEKYDEAMRLLAPALAEAEKRGWDSLVILAYTRIAYVELKRQNFEAAKQALSVVTAFARGADYPDELAFAYSALGRMALAEGDLEAAKAEFDRALAYEMQIGRPVGLADTYFYVGLIELELGDPRKAETTFQTALDIARGARSFGYNNLKNMEVKNHIGKALAYKEQGLRERACQEMSIADQVDARREIIYNPQTIALVKRIACPFGPLGFIAATN